MTSWQNRQVTEMNEIIQKHAELLKTFIKGQDKVAQILLDVMLKDAVENKMRSVRASYLYEKGEAEFYKKYGTVGEF